MNAASAAGRVGTSVDQRPPRRRRRVECCPLCPRTSAALGSIRFLAKLLGCRPISSTTTFAERRPARTRWPTLSPPSTSSPASRTSKSCLARVVSAGEPCPRPRGGRKRSRASSLTRLPETVIRRRRSHNADLLLGRKGSRRLGRRPVGMFAGGARSPERASATSGHRSMITRLRSLTTYSS